jgi:hypothetical protein
MTFADQDFYDSPAGRRLHLSFSAYRRLGLDPLNAHIHCAFPRLDLTRPFETSFRGTKFFIGQPVRDEEFDSRIVGHVASVRQVHDETIVTMQIDDEESIRRMSPDGGPTFASVGYATLTDTPIDPECRVIEGEFRTREEDLNAALRAIGAAARAYQDRVIYEALMGARPPENVVTLDRRPVTGVVKLDDTST